MYTVALIHPTGQKFLGRNRATLSGAEKLALQRRNELLEGKHAAIGVVMLDNSMTEIERWTLPTNPKDKPTRKRGRK